MNQRSVAVTGANGQIGRLVIAALANCDFRVTALVRGHESLSGCITVGDWLASKSAMTVLQDAHAVIHLAGSLNPSDHDYNKANITPTARLVEGVRHGRARRIIFLSYVGACEHSRNRYLSTKAQAELLLSETRIPLTVFRCTHIIGPPENPGPTASTLLLNGKRSVVVLGSGKQRVVPVYTGDAVAAILAALKSEKSGTFDLQGPEEMTLDDLVRLLNHSGRVRIKHRRGLRALLLHLVGPKLPIDLIDLMASDCRRSGPTAQHALNLQPTSLRNLWDKAG